MNQRFPAKRDSLLGWLSEFSEADWFPKGTMQEESNLSIYEDDGLICVEAALPGLKPQDIEVTYDKGVLWIRGEKKEEEEDKKKKFYRKASRQFSYNVMVPGDIDENKEPEATFKNGIMKITFKKKEKRAPKKLEIHS
jgi:HSP20 family protein